MNYILALCWRGAASSSELVTSMELPMPVTYVIRFEVVPEKRELFLELLNGVLDAMRNEPMFHEAILHRDPQSENRFMLYETWESHDDVLADQIHRPYRQAYHQALPELLREKRDVTIWEPLRADRRARPA